MHVAYVNYFFDEELAEPAQLLEHYHTLTGWAEGLAEAGAKVSVVQRFKWDAQIRRNGVVYTFVQDPTQRIGSLFDRAPRIHRAVYSRLPDVAHVNGLRFARQAWLLKRTLGPSKPVLLQDHMCTPPTRPINRLTLRFAMRRMDGLSFAARALARPWLDAGYISRKTAIVELMEGSSTFRLDQRQAARALSGLGGKPLCLWVGRLIPRKDPLTVLIGFAQALGHLPEAHLAMVYNDAELLPNVEAWLAEHPDVARHVTLLGERPHEALEAIYNSADFFLLGSHAEGSGYAVLEALSCGVVPIVTDIPTFAVLTDDGKMGGLWPVGDAEALACTLTDWHARLEPATPRQVRAFFDDRFSFAAIGRRALAVYQQLIERARPVKIGLVAPGGFDRSGTERVIPVLLWLVERLARRHEVHVYTLYQYPEPCDYTLLSATVHNLGRGRGPLKMPRLVWRTVRALQQEHYTRAPFHVLHGLWAGESGAGAAIAGRLCRIPTVVSPLGGELVALPDVPYGAQLQWRSRLWVSLALGQARAVVVASEFMRRAYAPRRPDTQRIALGVDTARFAPAAPPPGPPWRLLHVASLNRIKDQPTLLRAMQRIHAAEPATHLDIVGEDTLHGAIQRLAHDLGLDGAVTFHGFQTSEFVARQLPQAHLLLHTSRHEAGQMVVLEAAACGVPTVGTAVGHVADLAPDAAVAVPVGDDAALAAATLALLRDPARRQALGRRALAWAQAHDADWSAAQYEALYRRLAAEYRHRV